MIPRKPENTPRLKADTADPTGIPKARHETRNAAITPKNAARGAGIPRCRIPSRSLCGCSAMKYSRTRMGTAATSVERSALPKGS